MKKIAVLLLAAIMVFSMFAFAASAEEAPQGDPKDVLDYLWELSDDLSDEEFPKLGVRNFKFVQALEPIVEENSYFNYYKASVKLKQGAEGSRENFINAQNSLIMNLSVADGVYFLWDADNMPNADGESYTEEELDNGPLDSYGFIPLLVKCLIDDPTQAKGNIVAVAGGGMNNRSNHEEAYPAAEVFNELGYNVFILQRRIRPYSDEDIFMDMQRAIRMVRYYAQKEGWGGQDMIAAMGWSGGARTVMGAVNYLYGDLNPTKYCSTYVPDEIDAVSSDTDVTLPIYGGSIEEGCENTNLPAFYTCVGSEDNVEGRQAFYDQVTAMGIPARIDIFEGAGHGFGVGQEGAIKSVPECALWPGYADEFMQANLGYSGVTAGEAAVAEEAAAEEAAPEIEITPIPEEYTKIKTIIGTYGFGEAQIDAATNEDESKFYLSFVYHNEEQILEGDVDDSIVFVSYDKTGFMTGDAQLIWDDVVASPVEWEAR